MMELKCSKCPEEDHEGHFCRCESRNIHLAKELRERGMSPWEEMEVPEISIVDRLRKMSQDVIKDMKKKEKMNGDFSKITKTGIKQVLGNISRVERELDILLTQCESFGGFCHFYPTYCLEKMQTMRTILEYELKDDVIDP